LATLTTSPVVIGGGAFTITLASSVVSVPATASIATLQVCACARDGWLR